MGRNSELTTKNKKQYNAGCIRTVNFSEQKRNFKLQTVQQLKIITNHFVNATSKTHHYWQDERNLY